MELTSGFRVCDTVGCDGRSGTGVIRQRVPTNRPPFIEDLCLPCYHKLPAYYREQYEGESFFKVPFKLNLDDLDEIEGGTVSGRKKRKKKKLDFYGERPTDDAPVFEDFRVPSPKAKKKKAETKKADPPPEKPLTVDQVEKESDNEYGVEGVVTSGGW